MKRLQLTITGYVQGVSFRWWTLRQARGLRLTGWVKNLNDGCVEIIAEGKQKDLRKLVDTIKKKQGPMLASVENIEEDWQEATNEFTSFEIAK